MFPVPDAASTVARGAHSPSGWLNSRAGESIEYREAGVAMCSVRSVAGCVVVTAGTMMAMAVQADGPARYTATGAHDFACEVCHPAATARTLAAARGYLVYDARTNPDFGGGRAAMADAPGSSLICLECHDGSVSADIKMRGLGILRASVPSVGTDLRDDHPVGFSYLTAVSSRRTLAAVPRSELKLFGPDSRLECATCHDVHAVDTPHLLRVSTDSSALCIGCHL
jgi:predicted CXXCH cytochrome family protein